MTGVGDGDAVRHRVVDRVQAGRHAVHAEPLGLLVEVVQDLLRRQVQAGERLRGGAQLAHDGGRRHGVTHHVTDDQRDPAAGQRDGVVPVAADPSGLRGRQVAGGEPHAGGAGQRLGQHGALQLVRDVRLASVEHGLVDAERAVRGELGGHQQVVPFEGGALGTAQEQGGADDPAPAAQRGENRPLSVRNGELFSVTEEFGQRGTSRGGVGEHRADTAQHLGERASGPHLAQLGADRVQLVGFGLRGRQEAVLGVALGRYPVRAAQPEHQRARGPLVADRQRIAEIDQDRVGERGHGGPAQPHHDLVEIDATGDPPGGGTHEPEPVAVPPHRRGPAGRQALAAAPLLALGIRSRPVLLVGRLHRNALGGGPRPGGVALGGLFGTRLGVLGGGVAHGVLALAERRGGARLRRARRSVGRRDRDGDIAAWAALYR